jgi:hypothetical protein
MTFVDLCLQAQRGVDRIARRLRLGAPPAVGRRRLLIVQIDGLARAVLEQALKSGRMPYLRRLLNRDGYRLTPMSVGIPTSTPAFQMAAMYGVRPDIPGFHYHDKRRRTDIHFPRAGHAALVEAEQAAGRTGILQDGSVYGCAFTGGAVHDLFSFARLTRPRAPGVVRTLSAFVVVAWVVARGLVLTGIELIWALARMAHRPSRRGLTWRLAKKRIAISVWTREWFTLAVSRDAYDGVPAIYVNYLDYDETAHTAGPRTREAIATLRGVDRSIRHIGRVLRRVPEHRYDLYVLSDHGQAPCTPYSVVAGGRRFEHAFFDLVSSDIPGAPRAGAPEQGATHASEIPSPGVAGRQAELGFDPYLDVRESCERDGIRVVSAGPNAFVYFVDTPDPVPLEAIDVRWPGLAAALSKSAGVGLVLARAADGPVCLWRGQRHRLGDPDGGPFAEREDRAAVERDLAALMAMPSAGDLVVYGIDAPEGHVSYIDEVGAHAGPSPDERNTFVVARPEAGLPPRIDDPTRLYQTFVRYRSALPAA